MWVATGRDEQQGASARAVQLAFVDDDRLAGQIRKHGQWIAELARIDACQQLSSAFPG